MVSPSISHEVMGPEAMIFVFRMLSFKSTFSLYTFTFVKRLLSSSSLSAIRVVSSSYLRLLMFLLAESEEELKSLLMKVKVESEKVDLKLNILKTIMASSPITSWQIDGETMETETLFWGVPKSLADGDCSHEIK